MTSLPTAYTPLETLLLFQALRSEGVSSHSVFNRISEQLKSIPLVHDDPTYDSGRLSPDGLRELYLGLLKEEVKRDLEREADEEKASVNGDASPGLRKRKISSPHLPTVQEASQHKHLIPQLVTRLYLRYRENAVRGIREQEHRHDAIARDISEIESGKWDDRLQRQRTASATQSPQPSSSAHTQPLLNHKHAPAGASTTASPQSSHALPHTDAHAGQARLTQADVDAAIDQGSKQQEQVSGQSNNLSNAARPSFSDAATRSPSLGTSAPGAPSGHVPQPSPGYVHSPSTAAHPPAAGTHHAHPQPNAPPGPQVQPSVSQPSSSPRPALAPPPGVPVQAARPSHSASPIPTVPSGIQQQSYRPQFLPPPAQSSANEGRPPGYATPPIAHGSYYPPHQPYQDPRMSFPPPPPPYPQPHQHQQQQHPPFYIQPVQHGGHQMSPFPVEQSQPGNFNPDRPMGQQQSFGQMPPTLTHSQSPRAQHPPSAPATVQRPSATFNPVLVSQIIGALATPPRPMRRPVWKSEKRPSQLNAGVTLPSPRVEPLSPTQKLPEPPARATRLAHSRDGNSVDRSEECEPVQKSKRGRPRTKREPTPHSVASSTTDDVARMTRSQSASTVNGQLPAPEESLGSRDHVKIEPSTPAGGVEEPDASHETAPATPTSGRVTRKRRLTLQTQLQPPAKRSRQQQPSADEPPDQVTDDAAVSPPAQQTSTIAATRNFHKLSSTIMNDINSHKHASYFANAVRDRDAPGYGEIIKRPQHLKSIRAAITAGSRAMNNNATASTALGSPITSASTSKATATDGSAAVELEKSAEVMPPKAIVNATQLEKEVMRMFANAVMFNPGEDGMVRDTREMFEDVEAQMRDWRGAEREVEEASTSAMAPTNTGAGEEDVEEGQGKKRKT